MSPRPDRRVLRTLRSLPKPFVLVAVLATVVLGLAGARSLPGGSDATSNRNYAGHRVEVLGETLTASAICPTGGFCIQGNVNNLVPGSGQILTLTLLNPNNFTIYVTDLAVAPGTAATGCNGEINLSVPGWAATGSGPIPSDAISIGAGSTSSPAMATKSLTVSMLDLHNLAQNNCEGARIPLSYTGHALWYGNCVTNAKTGGLTVTAGQVDCITSPGKVTGGITVQSGGALVINPGGSVTGGVKAAGGATQVFLCGANITGGLSIANATGPIEIGGSQCAQNSITGGLTLTGNTGGLEVIGNHVTGGYTISGNKGSSPQLVESNTGTGGMTCTSNVPAVSDGGPSTANSVTGPKSGQCAGSF